MTSPLIEQKSMLENALGEQMIHHALVVLRGWAKELDYNRYADELEALDKNADYAFQYYLSGEDMTDDEQLLRLTTDTFRLMDRMYADMLVKRGVVHEQKQYDPNSMGSATTYFMMCTHLTDDDLLWLDECGRDPSRVSTAIMINVALAQNLRTCFNEKVILFLIDQMHSESNVLREQILANLLFVFLQYDSRIDFFPNIQDAFAEAIGDGELAFDLVVALLCASKNQIRTAIKPEDLTLENLPPEIREVIEQDNEVPHDEEQISHMVSIFADSEGEYMSALGDALPSSWVYDLLVGDNEERAERLAKAYLCSGRMDFMWDHIDEAEQMLLHRLREPEPEMRDYMNYGHCCYLKGDRAMAYEYYHTAREMAGSSKKFLKVFRPDRPMLAERGVRLEDIYLMEDHLLNV